MKSVLSWLLVVILCTNLTFGLFRNRLTKHFPVDPQQVTVVGLFGEDEEDDRLAFQSAVDDVNRDSNLLKRTILNARIEAVNLKNAYTIKEKLCEIMKTGTGLTAVFGANSEEGISIVRSITDRFKIPYLFSYFDATMYKDSFSINVSPRMSDMSEGIRDIIHDMDWASFTLLYEKDEDLLFFQDLLISHDMLKDEENYANIIMKQLPENEDYGPLLKEIRNSSETRIIFRCSSQKILPILRKARSLGLMGDYYAYVIASLDSHTINFNEFIETHTNITVLSLIESNLYYELEFNAEQKRGSPFLNENITKVKAQSLLTYDSMYLFAKALDTFINNDDLNETVLDCENEEQTFEDGPALINFLRATETNVVTSPIKINELGERNFYVLQMIQVSPKERNKLGTWDPETGIKYSRNISQIILDAEEFIANKTFLVSSKLELPYLSKCSDVSTEKKDNSDNECYEGFAKDIIDLIAKDQKFTYKFVLSPDGSIGAADPVTGKWNGIIKELQERRADLGICDLTITSDRRKVVDFTKPFMSLGVSILYRKSEKEESHMFSFLSPLDFQVWLCVATSLLGVSIVLFIVSRLTPYDWESSHPCDPNTEELENQMSLLNCVWFSLGSVLQQGSDILPKASSTRVIAAMWWFFTLIMASTYTANLAAFLTSQQMGSEIKDVNDLASQNVVKYGCKKEGSTEQFFKKSSDNLYQKIWATMESAKPTVFVKDNNEGMKRVLREKNYAFFMESATIEYMVERHCELTQVGGLLDNKGYGIAMPLNSPYRTQITTSLLRLQENGKLKEIKKKWWTNPDESKKCPTEDKDGEEENALAVSNVGGVFVVLLVGMTIAFIISVLEFLWNVRKVAVVEKLPLSTAFWKELHFIVNCHISTKPVRKPSEKTSESNGPIDKYQALMAVTATTNNLT